MSADIKLHAQVCINFGYKQVSVSTFSSDGKKVYEKTFNGIELVELSGISRILVGEHVTSNVMCISLESNSIEITQQGSILKIR